MPSGRVQIDATKRQVYCQARPLYGPDAETSAVRRLRAVSFTPHTLYIVCSPLLGFGITALQERLPADSYAAAVELDPEVHEALGADNCPAAIPYYGPEELAQLEQLLHAKIHLGVRRIELIRINGGYRIEAAGYSRLQQRMLAVIRAEFQNLATELHLGRLWIRNTIANYAQAFPAPLEIGTPEPIPYVVIGAGPSGDELLDALPGIAEYAAIVAVDTVLPTLLRSGISPDIVIALEAQHANLYDFVPGIAPWARYILDTSSCPALARIVPRDKIRWVHTRFKRLSLLRRLFPTRWPHLQAAGSVGPAAVQIANMLFSGPGLCAGLDFAYTVERSHARDSTPRLYDHVHHGRLDSPVWYRHAAPRSTKSVRARDGSIVISDLVLRRYQENFIHNLPASQSLYTIAGPGLPLHLPVISAQGFLADMHTDPVRSVLPPTGSEARFARMVANQSETESRWADAAAKQIEQEKELLQSALEQLDAGERLPAATDYTVYGLPEKTSPHQQRLMLRYYLDRWEIASVIAAGTQNR